MDYGQPVRFGVFLTPDASQPSRLLELAGVADDLGFELIGVQDHPYQRRFLDTWTLLTAIAMRTKTVKVFPDVANLPLRPPAIVAKAAATLDLLSGGRLELGLGAGGAWDAIKAIGGAGPKPGGSGRGAGGARQGGRERRVGGRVGRQVVPAAGRPHGTGAPPSDRDLGRRVQASDAVRGRSGRRRMGAVAWIRPARGPDRGQPAHRRGPGRCRS